MYHLIGKSNKRHSLFKTRPTLNCFTKTILHLRKVFYSLNASLCDVLMIEQATNILVGILVKA